MPKSIFLIHKDFYFMECSILIICFRKKAFEKKKKKKKNFAFVAIWYFNMKLNT